MLLEPGNPFVNRANEEVLIGAQGESVVGIPNIDNVNMVGSDTGEHVPELLAIAILASRRVNKEESHTALRQFTQTRFRFIPRRNVAPPEGACRARLPVRPSQEPQYWAVKRKKPAPGTAPHEPCRAVVESRAHGLIRQAIDQDSSNDTLVRSGRLKCEVRP